MEAKQRKHAETLDTHLDSFKWRRTSERGPIRPTYHLVLVEWRRWSISNPRKSPHIDSDLGHGVPSKRLSTLLDWWWDRHSPR